MFSLALVLISAQSFGFASEALRSDVGGYWSPRAGTRLRYHFKRVHASRTLEWDCPFHWMRVDSGLLELGEDDMVYYIALSGEVPFDARADHGIAHSLLG